MAVRRLVQDTGKKRVRQTLSVDQQQPQPSLCSLRSMSNPINGSRCAVNHLRGVWVRWSVGDGHRCPGYRSHPRVQFSPDRFEWAVHVAEAGHINVSRGGVVARQVTAEEEGHTCLLPSTLFSDRRTSFMLELTWHVFLRVKNDAKARLLLSRIETCLGMPVKLLECKRYWKDPELYDVSFGTKLDIASTDVTDAVYQTLVLAGRLGHGWEAQAPRTYDNGEFEFSGVRSSQCSNFSVSGLKWASFSLSNRPQMMQDITYSDDDP
jgi:hypothetical protein